MVASALLKLTGPQLAKKGKRSVENLSNYIRIRTDNNKFIVKAPGEKSARSLNKNATLNDAINFRNNLFKEKGYSKNEINLLLQPPVPGSNVLNFIKKQRAVDAAANKFNKNKPETWKGLLSAYGEKNATFVLPTDKKIRKFVIDKLKESSKATSNVFDASFNPTLTSAATIKKFSTTNINSDAYNQGLKKLGIKTKTENKSKSLKSVNEQQMQKLKNFLFSKFYTPGQKKHLREVNEMKKILNKRSGIYFKKRGNQDKALEIEHAEAVYDVMRKLGIDDIDNFIKNATPSQIDKLGKIALRYSNLQFATRLQNRGKLSKGSLFEVGNKGEHSKHGVMARHLEVERLRGAGKTDDADILQDKIEEDVKEFIRLRTAEAKAGMPLKFDYTKNDWLPEYAQIKSSDYYNVPEQSISQQIFNLAKEQGINFPQKARKTTSGVMFRPGDFKSITEKQFGKLKDGGRVEMDEGGTAFDALIKQNQEEHGMELKDAIDEAIKEMLERKGYAKGGRVELAVGGQPLGNIGGSSLGRIGDGPTNKVGTIESMLAGIGAGLIDIPRGAFVLGSALMDMGLGTNNAAKVEKFFDELTDLDEKADATTIGGIVRLLTNLGVPGAQAWNMGTKAATKALLAKRNGNYFRITDPKLEKRMKTALNGKGRLYATLGGAGAVGVSDAIFIGDVNKAGTLGDMFGGPTQLNENDENDSSKEVMNRMKFGLDSSLMMGVIGGTGSAIKTAVKRRNDMAADNDALDKFLSKLRPRGDKPQEFFEMERANIGKRAGDVNYAGEVARSLDKHIDGIFPFVVNPFNKMGNNGRKEFMKELNDVLLSGSPEIGVTGRFDFGDLDPEMVKTLTAKMKKMGAKQSDIDGVFKEFYNIRGGWGHMFSRLGAKMDKANLDEFRTLFSKKFSNYLGSTYEIFQNKSIIPMLNYRPSEEAVNKAMVMFKQSAKEAGEEITDAQARHYVDKIVEGARLPSSPTSGLYLDVPDFFANRTILDDLGGKSKIGYENFTDDAKQVINELLGKIEDPMQTVLAGTGRLSLIARRNEFYNDLVKRSQEEIAAGRKGFFYDDEAAAINALGSNIKKVEIDPSRTIEAGITNPMNGMYAEKAVAEAIEQSAMIQRDKEWYTQMYDSFILYPKATSQIAKTILSPITHVRNFVSAGAFAGANGLLPGVTISPDKMAAAMKDSYRALQTNLPGSRIANDEYRELLRLGVVNSNVRLGDLQRLLKDVQFGETLSAQTGLRGLTKQLSKVKKWTEDMYTAEDDFWKITSYALERQRLNDAYAKVGIKVDPKALNEEAASIVRNNIPNYDMVNEFVKGLRRLPFGNFVSFPAEIMRTTTNILGRALKEINYQHTLDDGRVVNPLRGIGMKRLFGLGATTVAVPYGVVEGAKTLYDVSGAEMDALRRFVPEWSRNSTLVPIKDRETGELKYIDFSHTNAYDTMIRPINTMINSIGKGVDEGEIMKNVAIGMFDATKETFSPFMSESIWFEAASDIILRGGRTREGRRLYTDETPWGEKVSIVAGHIAKTQVPGSVEAFKRLDLAVEGVDIIQKGKYDKYGRTYELGDELLGFAGARAVAVDPLRSMKFKIADYRTGVNNARREFTTPLLRGGPVDPADIVDRYAVANQALYNVNKELFDDYYAARVLGTKESAIDGQFADRVSTAQLNAIKTGRFKPFIPSENIIKAFADNAREIGERNPYRIAERQINRMAQKYNNLPLYNTVFPIFENPFNLPSAPLPPPATNVTPVGGLSPGSVVQTGMNNPLINNRTMQQGQRVFGSTDPIFGS
jgi:hypothetical protein